MQSYTSSPVTPSILFIYRPTLRCSECNTVGKDSGWKMAQCNLDHVVTLGRLWAGMEKIRAHVKYRNVNTMKDYIWISKTVRKIY